MKSSKSFQGELSQVCTIKQQHYHQLAQLHLPQECKKMLIKQVKNTKYFNWIVNKKYGAWKMQNFLALVQESRVRKFQAKSNFKANILKHIKPIAWSELYFLNLESNWITNVELLAYLQAPSIRWISLKDNQIGNYKAFRKMTFPKLKALRLDTHVYLAVFDELQEYNRHLYVVAKQILRNHEQTIFSEKIKAVLRHRRFFYPLPKERKKGQKDSDYDD